MSFEHPFQVDKVRQVLLPGAICVTKCHRTLSCEYLINLIRRRFENYHRILRMINKNPFKTRVVLNC